MLIAHHSTASAITPHASDRSWVAFFQTALPADVTSPIRIVGLKGAEIASELRRISVLNAYNVQIIGLIQSPNPSEHAAAIAEQYAGTHVHDDWYLPTGDLIAFIQHHAKRGLQDLLEQVHPGAISEHLVDLRTLAQILKCSEPTVRRMIERSEIPFMRTGRNYRFQPAEVLAVLRARGRAGLGRVGS